MTFNSSEYGLFLFIVAVTYAALRRSAVSRQCLLLAASYLFYMSWDWRYAGLIFFSTIVDFLIGKRLAATNSPKSRKCLLLVSLTVNLGLLAIFKYFNFFADTAEHLIDWFGWKIEIGRLRLLLPVGISFYTFQTLSYTIDLYNRKLEVESSFLRFAVFVSFFPQLVAGPIVRASQFLPQLAQMPDIRWARVHEGMLLICQGLIKKVLIADLLAVLLVDEVFSNPSEFHPQERILAVYGYAFQIYNDFSGYSDIAIGSALILGFRLPKNFARPYLATSIRDFWSRWHISLSTWLRDYLYIPLGGNRSGELLTKRNLMVTMLLGGLWHGASLNFIFWGGYHGLLLLVSHRLGMRQSDAVAGRSLFVERMRNGVSRIGTFHLVLVGWLLFRVESLAGIGEMFGGSYSGEKGVSSLFLLLLAAAAISHCFADEVLDRPRRWLAVRCPSPILGLIYAVTMWLMVAVSVDVPAFIYFQF